MGSGGKSKSQTVGYRYFMTIQYGLCRGPIDEIVQITAGDRSAWPILEGGSTKTNPGESWPWHTSGLVKAPYDTTIKGDRVTSIKAYDLFGGEKREGGIDGSLTVMMGKPTQTYPAWFKNLLGGDMPEFRGVATAIFDGMICAMNPYPKAWKFRLRRTESGWDGPVWQPTLATIWLENKRIKSMNGAHIIYECVTNRAWGRGISRDMINDESWSKSARTLFNEKFGLCMKWSRQDSLESFIQEVLDHIGGTLYTNRETGLLELDLIRDDYNPEDLPLFDKTSGLLSVDQSETATLSDATSEIIVKYKDIITNTERETRAQNLALIQSNEGTSSKTNSYSGITTLELASRLAQRDLKAISSSVNRYTVKLDRRAWRIHPGSVFRVSDPDSGIDNLVLRAGKVNAGTLLDGTIIVEAALDVFGMSSTSFVSPEDPTWVPPFAEPAPITSRIVREATYQEVAGSLGQADLAILDVSSTTIATIGARPNSGLFNYTVATRTGSDAYVMRGAGSFAPYARCGAVIEPYAETIPFTASIDAGIMEIGDLIQIGNEIILVNEIIVDSSGSSGTLLVLRGCVDTIPDHHASGSGIYFISGNVGSDGREYATGEVVDVKLLTNSSTETLDVALAPTNTLTMRGRQGRPYPPAGLRINSQPALNVTSVGTNFTISWTHRDRKLLVDQVVSHWDASVGPESGTTYNIRFYRASNNNLLASFTGITGNSKSFDAEDVVLVGSMIVEVESSRDGLVSTQKYRFPLSR